MPWWGSKGVDRDKPQSAAPKTPQGTSRSHTFEGVALPHLRAAFNLARWLTRNDDDAEDIVQEAYLRAFRFFGSYRGASSRAWMLSIVRNTFHTWREKNQGRVQSIAIDQAPEDGPASVERALQSEETPLTAILRRVTREEIDDAIASLSVEHREVFILREMEDLSYKEIAEVAQIPLGTVMSRLSRARQHLQKSLERTKQGRT